jgi:hypothetical protein
MIPQPDDQTILIDLSKWITCRFGLSEMSKMRQTGEAEQIYAEILRRIAGAAALHREDKLTTFVAAHDPEVWEPARAASSALRVEPATAVAQLQAEVRDAKAFVAAGCPVGSGTPPTQEPAAPMGKSAIAIQVEEGQIAQALDDFLVAWSPDLGSFSAEECHARRDALIAAVSAAALRQKGM